MNQVQFLSPSSFGKITVKAGDVYEWLYDVHCRSGHVEPKGSRLTVLDCTGMTPNGEIGPYRYNWVCRHADGRTTVWATLEQCIERRLCRKVQ